MEWRKLRWYNVQRVLLGAENGQCWITPTCENLFQMFCFPPFPISNLLCFNSNSITTTRIILQITNSLPSSICNLICSELNFNHIFSFRFHDHYHLHLEGYRFTRTPPYISPPWIKLPSKVCVIEKLVEKSSSFFSFPSVILQSFFPKDVPLFQLLISSSQPSVIII